MTIADTLRRAADIIDTHGWVQGEMVSNEGVCAMGAILLGSGEWDLCHMPYCDRPALVRRDGEWRALGQPEREACQAASDHLGGSLPIWNDEAGRTKEQVVVLLRAAADQADASTLPLEPVPSEVLEPALD